MTVDPARLPHRSRRDVIGWGSVTHPPECLDPRCPVVEAVIAGKVEREGGVTGTFDLYLQDDGWIRARHWALVR